MIKIKEIRYLDKEEAGNIMGCAAELEIFSERRLAARLGISPSYLNKILNGKKPLTRRVFNKLVSLGFIQ